MRDSNSEIVGTDFLAVGMESEINGNLAPVPDDRWVRDTGGIIGRRKRKY